MSGTTLCPHCNTRFKIAAEQLEAHHGMVRCGHCLQAFDARHGYIPDRPNPQLELSILDEPVQPELPADRPHTAEADAEAGAVEETKIIEETGSVESAEHVEEIASAESTEPAEETGLIEAIPPEDGAAMEAGPETPHGDVLDFNQPAAATVESKGESPHTVVEPVAQPMTLAEQVVIVRGVDEDDRLFPREYRRWPWAVATPLLLLALFAQTAYFFRVELAARLPGLKPALTAYCGLLGCSVPLPQESDLMSIESSDLEADAEHINQITLNALLRNRASYAQAYPNLELTLNDTQDKPLARRIFKPKDYLPPQESEQAGLLPNRELVVKLYLGTGDLRPTGYRLVLYYSRQ